jgi:hypothetical protein
MREGSARVGQSVPASAVQEDGAVQEDAAVREDSALQGHGAGPDDCAVLDWAASGAMALTGPADGPPSASPAGALAMLRDVTADLAKVTGKTGREVRADAAELLTARAAFAGLTRGGRVSAGGACFLLPAADGWVAVSLSRPDDLAAVPAIAGALGFNPSQFDRSQGDAADLNGARTALSAVARGTRAAGFAAAAQLLGVPAAALGAGGMPRDRLPGGALPWRTTRIAPPLADARLAGAVVADLSSMWAGPLCARMLGLAGADVIKVESPGRPDGARAGNPEFYDWLHVGQRSLAADFGTSDGRGVLADLLASADVVIESSRPRALAAAGLAPGMIPHRDGQVWLSITGYGQGVPDWVAFGDDAAVAGGLVGWTGESPRTPVFCADAVADPLAGVSGALAVALSRSRGGGERIDLSMRAVAALFASGAAPDHGPHQVAPDGTVTCPRSGRTQAVLPPRRPRMPPGSPAHASALGADTASVLSWLAGRAAC